MDLVLGDPPNCVHPVAWIGHVLGGVRRFAPRGRPAALLIYGTFLVLVVAGLAAAGAALIDRWAASSAVLGLVVQAWFLKCSFSVRGLFSAVRLVRMDLAAGDVDAARSHLGFHLVSRPTAGLDQEQVASATVESLAENLTDGWVAPLCLFVLGGLPAAWAYRAVNTADAMIGYRGGDLEYLGKPAARADDLLNLLPSRLAALALVAAALPAGASASAAWRILRRDGKLTESPNAGQTMAAVAGALGVTLAKPGHYRLGAGPPPDVPAIDLAVRVTGWAAGLCLAGALLVIGLF